MGECMLGVDILAEAGVEGDANTGAPEDGEASH